MAAQQKATVTSKTTAGAPAAPALRARARRASAQGAAKVQPVANKDVADVVKTSTTTVTLDTESDKENGSDGAKTRVNLVEDVRASAAKRQRIEDDVCVDSDDDGANVSSEDLDVAELLPQVDEPECVWDDLDEDDAGDPMMVSEYVVEIFEYMRELEVCLCYLVLLLLRCRLCVTLLTFLAFPFLSHR